jgi:hypothetical protein
MNATLVPLQYTYPMNSTLVSFQQIYPRNATPIPLQYPLQYTYPMNTTLITLRIISLAASYSLRKTIIIEFSSGICKPCRRSVR